MYLSLTFHGESVILSPIIDMYTNEVISYDLSMSPNLNQIKRMLETAFKKFKSLTGLIFHSDQGWQYQHNYYRQELKNRGIIQSMSRRTIALWKHSLDI